MNKILIIRLSSFGDIVQCLSAADALRDHWPDCEIHWLVRDDFSDFLSCHSGLNKIWSVSRARGLLGFLSLIFQLRKECFTHIYDAHNNLRSHIALWLLAPLRPLLGPKCLRRSKERLKRFLLFRWHKNLYSEWPYLGAKSYRQPLATWGISDKLPDPRPLHIWFPSFADAKGKVALIPSAAWDLKRWPIEYWQKLISYLPDQKFILLGGPQDTFCQTLADQFPDRVTNFAGQLSWPQSAQLVKESSLVISGDTGLLHLADYLGRPAIALIGPSAFGYPSRKTSTTLEVNLPCKPCSKDGRGHCRNPQFKKCMTDIQPETVREAALTWLHRNP